MQLKIVSLVGLIGIITLFVILVGAYNSEYILLELKYNNGNFSLIGKSVWQGNYPSSFVGNNYQLNVIAGDNKIVYSTSFDPSLLYTDGGNFELEGGVVELNQSAFYLAVPNVNDLKRAEIIKEGKIIFGADIYDAGAKNCRIK